MLVRFDSGFRDYGDHEPHLERAIHAVHFVAQHVKNQNRYDKVGRVQCLTYTNIHAVHFVAQHVKSQNRYYKVGRVQCLTYTTIYTVHFFAQQEP